MRVRDSADHLANLYIRDIVRLHGVPVSIVSDRDLHFTDRLWQSLKSALGTRLIFSMAYHPQTDGQSERIIQILEDMWVVGEALASVELAYNNSVPSSIGMAPFEALYGQPCRSPVCWAEVGYAPILGPEFV